MQKEIKKYPTLAQFVSETREKLGLSQTGLAKRCNLTLDEIANIESGVELFLSSTIRQKLAKGLKTSLSEIKLYEKKEDFHFVSTQSGADIEDMKNLIIENEGNKGFVLLCPVCGNKLITRVAKMYDLEDNLMLHPKARCSKCPFQIT